MRGISFVLYAEAANVATAPTTKKKLARLEPHAYTMHIAYIHTETHSVRKIKYRLSITHMHSARCENYKYEIHERLMARLLMILKQQDTTRNPFF